MPPLDALYVTDAQTHEKVPVAGDMVDDGSGIPKWLQLLTLAFGSSPVPIEDADGHRLPVDAPALLEALTSLLDALGSSAEAMPTPIPPSVLMVGGQTDDKDGHLAPAKLRIGRRFGLKVEGVQPRQVGNSTTTTFTSPTAGLIGATQTQIFPFGGHGVTPWLGLALKNPSSQAALRFRVGARDSLGSGNLDFWSPEFFGLLPGESQFFWTPMPGGASMIFRWETHEAAPGETITPTVFFYVF